MRRIVAATLLVLVAVTLAACGGGGAATTDATDANTAVAPPPTGGVPVDSGLDTLSPTETVSNEPFPQTKATPEDVLTRLGNKQAMILFFYDPAQLETSEQRAALDAVADKYRGLIDLMLYDVSAGRAGSDTAKDPAVQKIVDMAAQLKVTYTPYIVFVDRYGRVTYRFSGYTDQGLLEREALRATQ